jgi:hypothetical protein
MRHVCRRLVHASPNGRLRHRQRRAKLTPPALQARNGSADWIGKGLSAGAKVLIHPPAAVRDGVRVKARKA